ncbi:hypothetical protein [Alicyclobacillus sp. ALC3]|uniref:hypothetical protein n=1 Tax=Alicyclobacillus sp. ALC3 TaxID=2796143 RepID=UPI0023791139|nr:hypothetical protein [Alicyclobacillus sp. ALC3]WDL98325.1 hypothetical protein JC200_06455 [Alicyclobacillus sp. ALC3]
MSSLRPFTFASAVALCSLLAGCSPFSASNRATSLPAPKHAQPVREKHVVPRTPAGQSVSPVAPVVLGVRKFPFPFQAMLAVSSDADHETLRKFNLAHEFLNSTSMTPMGRGLGLDIADSFFMYNGSNIPTYTDVNNVPLKDELTWFRGTSSQPYAASVLNQYIKDGWIDTLHTYGDFSRVNQSQTVFTRALAARAIATLRQNGDFLTVWTDHGNQSNVDNFGAYQPTGFDSYQQGANPWSKYYHTNLLIPYGVKFVWADRASDVFGRTSMIYPIVLPSGQKVWGFWRYTNSGYTVNGSPIWEWTVNDIPSELSTQHLQQIASNHQYAIIATHLSANNNYWPFSWPVIHAFQYLQKEQLGGHILVARTSRLLNYNVVQQYLHFTVLHTGNRSVVDIEGVADPVFGWYVPTLNDLHGITFYTNNPIQTTIEVNGKPVPANLLQRNTTDGYAPSIGFKWYAPNTTNYAIQAPGIK